jgi:hypothetical protein
MAAAFLLWFFCKRIVWFEALVLAASGFLISTIYYACVVHGAYADAETWSGQVITATHHSRWLEYYEYAVYRTEIYSDSKGHIHTREVFDHWEPTSSWHDDSWDENDTLVSDYSIDQPRFEDIHRKFGKITPIPGIRYTMEHNSHMLSGDPNDYQTINENHYVYPVTTIKHWENHVKASPSVFSYKPVPETIPVFPYPKNKDHFVSDRILGPVDISHEKWDQLNSELGPTKKVNLIICSYGDQGSDIAQFQESKYIGGKKNDLIVCYGGPSNKPTWVHVFGWTESDLVKLNIETIILDHGVNNDILPLIKAEVIKNYKILEWHKFDYLKAEIPFIHYVWLLLVICGVGTGWILFSIYGLDIEKGDTEDNLSVDGIHHKKKETSIGQRMSMNRYKKHY